jgi:hypothetical protein
MKIRIYTIIFMVLTIFITISCEKDKADCPEAPANLRCGSGSGSICAVYHYSGGMFTGISLSLNWNSVSNADGYNVYAKGTSGTFKLEGTTETTHFSASQGRGALIWAVKAYKGDCESSYSNEFKSVVSK